MNFLAHYHYPFPFFLQWVSSRPVCKVNLGRLNLRVTLGYRLHGEDKYVEKMEAQCVCAYVIALGRRGRRQCDFPEIVKLPTEISLIKGDYVPRGTCEVNSQLSVTKQNTCIFY